MALPSFLQSQTYSTNTASTTHAITLGSAVRSQGTGGCEPSTLVLTISYDGNTGSIVTGITDTDNNTWQVGNDGTTDIRTSNGTGVNGEMWYAYNIKGGGTPTITVTLSASQKATIVVAEVDQVRPVSPLDKVKGNINTAASTSRIGSTPAKRGGQIAVCISGLAFNDATMTCTGVPVSWQGYVGLKDGSSGVGAGMAYKAGTEATNLAGGLAIARYNMSATTTPIALMSMTFYRDGVITSTDDGWIDNFELTSTLYTTDTTQFIFTSSTSAPGGGTGSSEKTQGFSFFPTYTSYMLTGVTLGSTFTLTYSAQSGGFDDGTNWELGYIDCYKSEQLGTTLDITDESRPAGDVRISLNTELCTAGNYTKTLTTATDYDQTKVFCAVTSFEGDTGGMFSGTWAYIGDYSGSTPEYLKLTLVYPTAGFPHSFGSVIG